jgi:hypothetical protein
VKEL